MADEPSAEPKERGGRVRPPVAIRPARAVASVVRGFARPALRRGRVPGRRHRDQRPGGRPLRADRGRRRAGRRRRAARDIRLAGADGTAAVARHPALHRASRRRWSTPRRRRAEVLAELGELLEGRVLVAHSARFDRRVLRQAFERAGSTGPRRRCSARCSWRAASRRSRPKRALAPLADSLGIEVTEVHRALPDALTCARVFCALFPRVCAQRRERGRRARPARGRAAGRARREPAERIPPSERPDLSTLPDDPGVYIFRDERGRPLYVGKSVSLRSRARAHFCAPGGLDRARRDRRLPADQLGARARWCWRTG